MLKFTIDFHTIVLTTFVRVMYLHFILACEALSFVIQCRKYVFMYYLLDSIQCKLLCNVYICCSQWREKEIARTL